MKPGLSELDTDGPSACGVKSWARAIADKIWNRLQCWQGRHLWRQTVGGYTITCARCPAHQWQAARRSNHSNVP